MNPGQGKVHRDCAARCLSGGIPPIFVTTDGHEQFLLVGLDGRALGRDALREFIAEPITIRENVLATRIDSRLLKIDPRSLRHTPNRIEAALAITSPLEGILADFSVPSSLQETDDERADEELRDPSA